MVYFELLVPYKERQGNQIEPGFYVSNAWVSDGVEITGRRITHVSERIWLEQDGKVKYVKNRSSGCETPIDAKEFMWIKLTAKVLN